MSRKLFSSVQVALLLFYKYSVRDSRAQKMVPTTIPPPAVPEFIAEYSDDDVVAISREDLVDLHKNLLYSYDRRIRPLFEQASVINVNTKFVPTNIIEFETSKQRLSILGYVVIGWRDELITWNPDSYGGTNFVKIPVDDIWMPNLKIIEEFDGKAYIGDMETDIAKISSDGDVQWVPEGIHSVVCKVDIQYYPYDEQKCTFTYYIANESNNTVALTHTDEVILEEFIENSAWKLVKVEREQELKWGTYFINIHFDLQRRAHFATFTVVTPLLMLAFLNIGVFIVPNSSGEKGTFAITIFLSYGIFITIVSDTLPHNSLQTSYFVVFIISLLGVSALTVFYAIVQAKLFATIGNSECKLPWSKQNANKTSPMERGENIEDGTGIEGSEEVRNLTKDKFTWGMMFDKIDTILCIAFFVLVSVATAIFFCVMFVRLVKDMDEM